MNSSSSRFRSPSAPSTTSLVYQFKGEAEALQALAKARGETLKRGSALEAVARQHGYKDWNAAAAATLPAASQTVRYAFEDVDVPLPKRPLRLHQAGDPVNEAIREIYRWAQQLEFIADKVEAADRRDALALIGGEQPYVFVLDAGRWPGGMYHLCDRGYEAFEGLALTREELEKVGVVAWEDWVGTHGGGDMFSVVNDDVLATRDAGLLKKAARLLVSIASVSDEKQYGDRSTVGSL